MPVAEWPQQPHHAGQDLGVRQAGHILGEPGNRVVELRLRHLAERRIRPSLDLTGEERQVGPPALVARHGCRVDDAEHLAHGLVAEQWFPVLVALRTAEIPQTKAERPAQLPHRALVIAAPDMTGGHPVGDLRGEHGLVLVPVRPDAHLVRRRVGGQRAVVVTELEARLRETHPVPAHDGVELHYPGPQHCCVGPAGRVALRLGTRQGARIVADIRHGSSQSREALRLAVRGPSTA